MFFFQEVKGIICMMTTEAFVKVIDRNSVTKQILDR